MIEINNIIDILNSRLLEKKENIKNKDKLSLAINKIKLDTSNIRNVDEFIYDKNIDNIKVILKGKYDKGLSIELTKEQVENIDNYYNKLTKLEKEYSSINEFELELLEKLIKDTTKLKDVKDYDTIYLLIRSGYIDYDLKEKLLLEFIK